MQYLDKIEDFFTKPGRLSRRSALGRIVKGCTAIAAALAGIQFYGKVTYAYAAACCNLLFSYCSTYDHCPCGGTHYEWYCSYGPNHCPWVCGECYGCSCSYAYPQCRVHCPC